MAAAIGKPRISDSCCIGASIVFPMRVMVWSVFFEVYVTICRPAVRAFFGIKLIV
jgi:hypothetical protein